MTYNSIPFNAPINMNKNTTEIKQYSGFNKRNSPMFGGCLSPLYMKKSTSSGQTVTDSKGNIYAYSNGTLYKNGISVMTMATTGITSAKLSNMSLVSSITVDPSSVVDFCYDQGNSTNFTYMTKGANNTYTIHYQSNGAETTASESIFNMSGSKIFYYDDRPYVFIETNTGSVQTVIIYSGTSRYYSAITPGTTSNTWHYSVSGFTQYPSYTITNAWKSTINVGIIATGALGISFILSDGDRYLANSFVLYETGFKVYPVYFEEPLANNSTIVVGAYTYPNVFLGNGSFVGYIGPDMYSRSQYDQTTFYLRGLVSSFDVTASLTRTYCLNEGITSANSTTVTYENVVLVTCTKNMSAVQNETYINAPDNTASACFDFMYGRERIYFSRLDNDNNLLYTTYDSELGVLNTGLSVDNGYFQNYNGACVPFNSRWNVLYNNRLISGASSLNHILVTEWNNVDTVDGIYAGQSVDELIYRDVDGYYYKLVDNATVTMNYVLNRYLIFNTTSNLNLYDTETGRSYYYSTDWNNRIFFTSSSISTNYGSVVSAMNAYLENTTSTVASSQFPASIMYRAVTSGSIIADWPINGVAVQVYTASTSTLTSSVTPVYNNTYKESSTYYESSLSGISYSNLTSNILYNPNIFAKFISSYTNQNMIMIGNNAYILMYYNNICYLLYYLLSGVNNVSSSFIIQSVAYCVSGNKIYKTSYSDGTLTLTQAIVDVTGMAFLGASPYKALFYSPVNKTIYSFNGDATLSLVQEANVINSIDLTAYNSTTYKFYIATDAGLYIMNGDETTGTYCIANFTNVASISFTNGYPVVKLSDGSIYDISYYYQDGYTPTDIDMETCYYGPGQEICSVFDCWFIKLFNNGTAANGDVAIKIKSLTDKGGFNSEEKTLSISKKDWDANGNYYFRYKPRYMNATGMSLCLTSPFPVVDITVSHTDEQHSQLSKYNI